MPENPTVKKRGRPKLEKDERRAVVLQARVQPDELAGYHREAEKKGLTLSEFVRQTLNSAVKQ